MSFEPYRPPSSSRGVRPAAILWFRVYAAMMSLVSLAMLVLVATSRLGAAPGDALPALALAGIALVLAVFYAVAAFVPWKPWGWTWALAAIAVGVAGGGAVFAIPLCFFWWKPEVKAAFGRL